MKNDLVIHEFQPRTRKSIEEFVTLVEEFREPLKAENLQLSAWRINSDDIDYERELKKEKNQRMPRTACAIWRTDAHDDNKETLIPSNRLVKFLDDITLDAEREEDREEKGDMVTLITTHSCKAGYPHVFLVRRKVCCRIRGRRWRARWMRSGGCFTWPSRAMQTLAITHCRTRMKYGSKVLCHPSSFLKEVPEELCDELIDSEPVSLDEGRDMFTAMREMLIKRNGRRCRQP